MMQAAIIMKFYSLLHFGIRLNAPLLLGETAVVVVTPLSVCLGGCEEFGSFGGILLHYGSVAYLTLEDSCPLPQARDCSARDASSHIQQPLPALPERDPYRYGYRG